MIVPFSSSRPARPCRRGPPACRRPAEGRRGWWLWSDNRGAIATEELPGVGAPGAGRLVLFSFAPYLRGQTEGTFALLYNAVMLEMMEEGERR